MGRHRGRGTRVSDKWNSSGSNEEERAAGQLQQPVRRPTIFKKKKAVVNVNGKSTVTGFPGERVPAHVVQRLKMNFEGPLWFGEVSLPESQQLKVAEPHYQSQLQHWEERKPNPWVQNPVGPIAYSLWPLLKWNTHPRSESTSGAQGILSTLVNQEAETSPGYSGTPREALPNSPTITSTEEEFVANRSQIDEEDMMIKLVDPRKITDLSVDADDEIAESDNVVGPNENAREAPEVEENIFHLSSQPVALAVQSDVLSINLSAKELQDQVNVRPDLLKVSNCSILGDKVPPPSPPVPPKVKLNKKQLQPPTPSMDVQTEADALSPELEIFCKGHPIAVIKNFASALNMNLNHFSTNTLAQSQPDQFIEVRTQRIQNPDENCNENGETVWECKSEKGVMRIGKYAAYQASSHESLTQKYNRMLRSGNPNSRSKNSSGNSKRGKTLMFGTNVDLSDKKKWDLQLRELRKLPSFTQLESDDNMLTHVGGDILGVNTVQVYMKVAGCRTPGHQENLNFCSVNINIGPSDCEWFATPQEYWGAIKKLCEQKGIDYLSGSWWPDLEECAKEGIPIYRFLQKSGDLVWVNCGCVHWVQALGLCNNVAWNVGRITAEQYRFGIERYEWNKLSNYRSIVPMIQLSWRLATNFRIDCPELFTAIKTTLMMSLAQCFKLQEFIHSKNVEVVFMARKNGDCFKFCLNCEVELFNIMLIKRLRVPNLKFFCLDCARKMNSELSGFKCIQEYDLKELMGIYDKFNLPI